MPVTGIIQSAPAGAWDPTDIGSQLEGWFDASDLASQFQSSDGTTAVAVADPVGFIDNKGAAGQDAIQATTGSRPILRQDASSNYYWEFNGSRSIGRAVADFTNLSQPGWVALAVKSDNTANSKVYFDGNQFGNDRWAVLQSNTDWRMFAGSEGIYPALGGIQDTDIHVHVCYFNGTSSWGRLDQAERATSPGTGAMQGLCLGALDTSNVAAMTGRIYQVVYGTGDPASFLSDLEDFLASKSGVTL